MEKRKIIIDCDPGIDDSLAIMLALSSEEVEVIALTIVCGNSPVEMGRNNALKVLKHMNRLDIPVYVGCGKPLKREYINALDTHGRDGLGESFLEEIDGYVQQEDAVTFMSKKLLEETCSVIALGPMTNLAALIEKSPESFAAIDELVSMGGTFKSHGNCSPVAEYNYWCDPDAAKRVFETAQKENKMIHMVGLDVTREIVFTPTLLAYMKRLDSLQGEFVEKITKFYFDFHWEWEHIIGCVINDPLAVAYFMDRSICSGFESYVDIEVSGISIGQSVVDSMDFYKRKKNAKVLTNVDKEKFFRMFFSKILKIEPEKLDLLSEIL